MKKIIIGCLMGIILTGTGAMGQEEPLKILIFDSPKEDISYIARFLRSLSSKTGIPR